MSAFSAFRINPFVYNTLEKKILILSQSYLEGTTDTVCMWLNFLRAPYQRFNGEDLFKLENLNQLPNDDEVGLVWYRRKIAHMPVDFATQNDSAHTHYTMNRFLINEFDTLHSSLFYTIDKTKWFNDPVIEDHLNKLRVLQLASKLGLKIPFTEVLTDKKSLIKLQQAYPVLIVKPLSDCIMLEDDHGNRFKMLTQVIDDENMDLIPEQFFPSMVQERVEKTLEIRSFYLDGCFYSMAIFSQGNSKTTSDFRNYDKDHPNRTVPYKLPADITSKLQQLMQRLNLKTGSIDLILDQKRDYYFLEINPAGQFGMVSYPCNYYLEKKMATTLLNQLDNEKEVC